MARPGATPARVPTIGARVANELPRGSALSFEGTALAAPPYGTAAACVPGNSAAPAARAAS